jgi:hypothetical protein
MSSGRGVFDWHCNACRVQLVCNKREIPLKEERRRQEIKTDLEGKKMYWIHLAEDRGQ